MTIDAIVEATVNEVKENLLLFFREHADARLTPVLAARVTQELQQRTAALSRTVLRAFLESKEEPEDVIVVGGETFRFKQFSTKACMSVFGPMELSHKLYQNAADSRSYAPLDAAWGMAGEYLTLEVREAVAVACANVTPEETLMMLRKIALFQPDPTTIKRTLAAIEACIAPQREEMDRRIRAEEKIPEETRAVVASMDGVNVLLNEPGAKCGRPAERPKGEQNKEKNTAYKNAMVGSISFYGAVKDGEKCPERLASHYVSQMPEERAPTFKAKFEAELDDVVKQCAPDVRKVLLCDGARSIWNYLDGNKRFDDFEKLVDYCHSAEHLSLAAEALFGKGSEDAKAWFKKYGTKLKEEARGAQSVLDSIDYYATTRKRSAAQRKDLKTQRTFFARNKHRMNYASFRARGLPIGSGPVEAACKTLVKARMCRSGMRWSRQGGQRILDLRTYLKSGRWEAFWREYTQLATAI